MSIDTGYRPLPKQMEMHSCYANEILFGGAAGPGKSHALRHEGLDWALRIPGFQVYLFRRTYPELEKNHIIPSQIEFPKDLGAYKDGKRRWEFNNGSMMHFCHCQYDRDVFQYQGAEIHLFLPDELTTFTEFQYDYLRGRVRCALDIPERYRCRLPGIVAASNPGGVGHEFCKRRWVDFAKPNEVKKAPAKEGGMSRCYIPALLHDNPILMERDPEYIHRLDALPEPYRTAYKDGRWDIFMGQAFSFCREYHVTEPLPIPRGAQIYSTFDWGFGAPFSWGWWWVDNDGRGYRFAEWYGWNGTPNQGLRYEDSRIADEIKKKEVELQAQYPDADFRRIMRKAGPDCFQKKPDYKGGGQGPSTSEVFASRGIYLSPGDPSRDLKIRQFRERLKVPRDEEGKQNGLPMLMVYENCEQFIRTIPLIQTHKTNPEEIDQSGEDHIFDECSHFCMARPIAMSLPQKPKLQSDRHIDRITRPTGSGYEDFAARERRIDEQFLTREAAMMMGMDLEEGEIPRDGRTIAIG